MDVCAAFPIELHVRRGRGPAKDLHGQLREAILEGRLASGFRLPPTRTMALLLGLARATIVVSYEMLISGICGVSTWRRHLRALGQALGGGASPKKRLLASRASTYATIRLTAWLSRHFRLSVRCVATDEVPKLAGSRGQPPNLSDPAGISSFDMP